MEDLMFLQGWLHYSMQKAENWKMSALLRDLKMCRFTSSNTQSLTYFTWKQQYLARAASSQHFLLAMLLPAIFEACLCFEALSRQLDHQRNCAVATFARFYEKGDSNLKHHIWSMIWFSLPLFSHYLSFPSFWNK